MTGWAPYVVAGVAIAMPLVLDEGEKLSLVPAFVTDAQRAALATLAQPIIGISPTDATNLRALDRVSDVCRALIPLRGAIDGRDDLAKLTGNDVDELLTACLDAARAGVLAGGSPSYDVATTLVAPLTQANMFDAIAGGQVTGDGQLTDLGAAVREAVLVRNSARNIGDITQVPGQLAAKRLALAMDSAGYLITGQPFEPSVGGGLAAAAGAVESFVGGIAGDAIGAIAGVAADVALSTPGLLVIAGIIAWKVIR